MDEVHVANYKLDDNQRHNFLFGDKTQLLIETVLGAPSNIHEIRVRDEAHERGVYRPYHDTFVSVNSTPMGRDTLAKYVAVVREYVQAEQIKDLRDANLENITRNLLRTYQKN